MSKSETLCEDCYNLLPICVNVPINERTWVGKYEEVLIKNYLNPEASRIGHKVQECIWYRRGRKPLDGQPTLGQDWEPMYTYARGGKRKWRAKI